MKNHYPRMALMVSGSGSTAEALIRASQEKPDSLRGDIGIVISNNEGVGAEKRVAQLNREYGLDIEYAVINKHTYPDEINIPGQQSERESEAITKRLSDLGIHYVQLAGYTIRVVGSLLDEYGQLASHGHEFWRARMGNSHPGPLPLTAGLIGLAAQQKVIEQKAAASAHTYHLVNEAYDKGKIQRVTPVPVGDGEPASTLFERVQTVEKEVLPVAIGEFILLQARMTSQKPWNKHRIA
jgi:phosphoribosylglycinamide formyltransferase-1